ncbi:MAG: tetratricopeptide repeat protein [Candidatus Lokiarchaeota archaeon]|nr:tetratricopeptide repeat protein [Candidatus Lokiarchaeota archaeon]
MNERLKITLEMLEKTDKNDISKFNNLLNEISGIYFQMGQFNISIEYTEQALSISMNVGDIINQANELSNLGLICKICGKFKDAIESFTKTLELDKTFENKKSKIISDLLNIGESNELLEEWDQALEAYNNALELVRELKSNKDKEFYVYHDCSRKHLPLGR